MTSTTCSLTSFGAVAACSLLFLTGCSSGFEKSWRAAKFAEPPRAIEGRWSGTWRSETNGHHDALRCLVEQKSEGLYEARFHAKYKMLFRFTFSYSVPLTVVTTNGMHTFKGKADLGWLAGGHYRYRGEANFTNWHSTYRSKYDHGEFQLERVQGDPKL